MRQLTIERDRWDYGAGVTDNQLSLLGFVLLNLGLTQEQADIVEQALGEPVPDDHPFSEVRVTQALRGVFQVTFTGTDPDAEEDVDNPDGDCASCGNTGEHGNYCSGCGAALP